MSKLDEISERAFDEDGDYQGLNGRDALFLVTRLRLAEKALEKIINEADDHKVKPWERMKEMEKYANEALQQLRS